MRAAVCDARCAWAKINVMNYIRPNEVLDSLRSSKLPFEGQTMPITGHGK